MREHKVLKIFLCIIALTFVIHQIYSSVYKPVVTVSAEYSTASEGMDITGILIRQEKLITNNNSGALHFIASDGERVAKNGVIANIYSSADTSVTVSRIQQLEEKISNLEEMMGYNDVQAADLSLANSKVNSALDEFIRSCAAGDFSSTDEKMSQLLTNLSRKQMITGEQTDFSAQLEQLKNELNSLNSTLPSAVGSITADSSGYFVSDVDGYEGLLSSSDIDSVTPEFLDSIMPDKVPADTVGKIVSDYEWYIAAKVSINESLQYKQGDNLTITTQLRSCSELSVTVKQINMSASGEYAVILFSCQQLNSELASMRTGAMTVIKKTYSGLKIPRKALRVNDEDVTGVYVVSGISLKFVPVNVIYNTDEYIICEQTASNDNVLRLYDEVVIKGKRLYDGKIIG